MSARDLLRDGYVGLELPEAKVGKARALVHEYLGDIPEHRAGAVFGGDYGAGSFGAINLASAYHCAGSVHADLLLIDECSELLVGLAKAVGYTYIEAVPDRLFYRTQRQRAESWHTDNTAGARSSEEIYLGVVLNLGLSDQHFTLAPGTHQLLARLEGGDYTPTNKTYASRRVTIRPNSCLVFFENIVHCVTGPATVPVVRKMLGFRLSDDPRAWNEGNATRLADQGALVFKGGQLGRLVPALYVVNHAGKCEAYCARLRPEMLTKHVYKTGARAGQQIVVPMHPPLSLGALGAKYTQDARAASRFTPRRVQDIIKKV